MITAVEWFEKCGMQASEEIDIPILPIPEQVNNRSDMDIPYLQFYFGSF